MIAEFSWSLFTSTGSIEAFLLYAGCRAYAQSDHLVICNREEAAYG